MAERTKVLNPIRTLLASEIECRVGMIKPDGSGCSLLLYKDARVDMRLLDEVYGPMNWKRDHELINGNLFCTLYIWDEGKKEWVSKQDVGTESYTEKEKGQASDAFKRAGFNWGIGRELYTSPFIWINLADDETFLRGQNRSLNTKFSVKEIGYNEYREVDKLVIVDNKGKVRYTFGDVNEKVSDPSSKKKAQQAAKKVAGVYSGAELQTALSEMSRTISRKEMNEVWQKYPNLHNVNEFRNLTIQKGKEVSQ